MAPSKLGLEKSVPDIMPQTRLEIEALLDQSSTMNPKVQAAMLKDPAIIIALFREFKRQQPKSSIDLVDCAHAISMLGIGALRRILASLNDTTVDTKLTGLRDAYSQFAHAASIGCAISEYCGIDNAEIATAAILQNPAIVALWHTSPEAAQRANSAMHDGLAMDVAYSAELGEPLNDANRRLAKAWGFPSHCQDAIGRWDPLNRHIQQTTLCSRLAQTVFADINSEETELYTDLLADYLDADATFANSWLKQILAEAARELTLHHYPTAAYQIPLIPGDEDYGVDSHEFKEKKANVKLHTPADDMQTVISKAMREMKKEAQIPRVAFLMFNKDLSVISTRMVIGGDKTDSLRKLKNAISNKHLFSLLRAKPQSIQITPQNFDKYAAHIPRSLLVSLGTRYFCAMSIFINKKPAGILYADGGQLQPAQYQAFKNISLAVNKKLNRD